jgi:alpha-tubulin suppressor-like RCC1 family protein
LFVRKLRDVKIGAGGIFACIMTSSMVSCWGHNTPGKLGRGDTINVGGAPTDMSNLNFISFATSLANLGVADLSVGSSHSCVLFANGLCTCWGDNSYQQLDGIFPMGSHQGDASLEIQNLPPITFAPTIATIRVVQIAAKTMVTCGI